MRSLVAAVAESRGAILPADRQQIGRIPTAPNHRQDHTGGNPFDDVLDIEGIPQGSLLTAFRPTSGLRRRVDD
jgi:hypothetical protein